MYKRQVHSLTAALSQFEGNRFVFISPEDLRLPRYVKTESLEPTHQVYTCLLYTSVQLAGEDPAAQQAFSLEDKITSRTPPVFVWHTMEDETVPVENTLLLVSALHRAGVPCEAHLFEKGCHGTSLSTAEVNHPSAQMCIRDR